MVGYGHVAPCAGRCAGSRRPDHARRPSFVRSRRHAHARPRRAIPLSAGPLWSAHQHGHIHQWPRTTFSMGGQEAGQERGRHRQRISHATCDIRARLAQRRLQLGAAGSQQPFCQHCCQHVATAPPCHTCHPTPHHTAPCCAGPVYALCTGRLAVNARLGRPAALLAFTVEDAQGVHWCVWRAAAIIGSEIGC